MIKSDWDVQALKGSRLLLEAITDGPNLHVKKLLLEVKGRDFSLALALMIHHLEQRKYIKKREREFS